MELWIRTQDKEGLLKINRGIMYWLVENKRHTIVNQENEAGLNIVAEYKTKERALQVLDEIQNILRTEPLVIVGSNEEKIEYKELSTYVYEMPQE